jgi:hypothetical protein
MSLKMAHWVELIYRSKMTGDEGGEGKLVVVWCEFFTKLVKLKLENI